MNNPYFSVITCTRNSEKFICKNLESVKSQSFKDFEQIIIDGQSTDKTIGIVKEYARENPRIKIFSFPPKGISNAFNKGIEKSNGKYLFFLNSDDSLYDNGVLKDVAGYLDKNPDLDWIYGKINVVEEDGRTVGEFPRYKIFQSSNKWLLKFINYIPHQAVFMKKEVFEKLGYFDANLETGMDYEYWLRISKKIKWIFFNRLISNYLIHKGSFSSSEVNMNKNLKIVEDIQKTYLDTTESIFAKMINRFLAVVNKTYR